MKILCTYVHDKSVDRRTHTPIHTHPQTLHQHNHPTQPPTHPTLTLGNVLVPAHGEVVDAAHVGPVEARWKVLHVNVLVRQRLRDPLALGESSCVKIKRTHNLEALESKAEGRKLNCLLFGTLHGLWCGVSADAAPRRTASKKATFIFRELTSELRPVPVI